MGVMTVDGSKARIEHDAETDSFRGETLGPNKAATDRSRSQVTARARALQMVLCGVVSAVSLTACERVGSYYWQGILVNETPSTISVTFSVSDLFSSDGTRLKCQLESTLWLGPAPTRRGAPPSEPYPRPYLSGVAIDHATCSATFQLGPSQAAYGVFVNWPCAGDERNPGESVPPLPPFFDSLSITAGGRTQIWRGWAAVEQFKRRPSGHCVFAFSSR